MSFHPNPAHFAAATAEVAPATVLRRNSRAPHVFDLHPALHIAVFGGFAAYLAIMWAAFGTAELAIPFVIFGVFLAGSFAVPAWWARVAPPAGETERWSDFMESGIECETGKLSAGAAMVQVLIMPAMLILWGLSVAVIRALV